MTTARKQLVSVDSTPYYHCVSRCVRRSFLCGIDPLSQKSYEHRREWVEKKILALAQLYCIDICAYAVMSNHYHLVVHLNRDKATALSNSEVVMRWGKGHHLPSLIRRWQSNQLTSIPEKKTCEAIIEEWRARLWSLSWFMKELNFDIALRANEEDGCSGHFWESRFKSQALLDEQALAAAMTYVDLNPLRSGIADKPESSEYTSIQSRLKALKQNKKNAPCLYPFTGNQCEKRLQGIPFQLYDYLELIDWTARQYKEGKASMSPKTPPILQRLGITQTTWLTATDRLETKRATAIGCQCHLWTAKRYLHKARVHLFRLDI